MKQPTQEEIQASGRLASWLEGEKDQAVDADVLEAIYVISPERCPEPRVSIEDVLGRVEFGPFGQGEAEIEGTEEDEEYLRELLMHSAPVPKTSLEDILSRVQSGPFAATAPSIQEETTLYEEAPEEEIQEELPDNVVPLRAWWQRTEVALFAAAAVALLILIPSNFQMPEEAEQAEMATVERKEEMQKTAPTDMADAEEAEEAEDETTEGFPPPKSPVEEVTIAKDSKLKKEAPKKKGKVKKPKTAEAGIIAGDFKQKEPAPEVNSPSLPTTALKAQNQQLAVTEKRLEEKAILDNSRNEANAESQKDMDGMLGMSTEEVVVADSIVDEKLAKESYERNDYSREEEAEIASGEDSREGDMVDEPQMTEPQIEDLADDVVVADMDMVAEEDMDMMESEAVEEIAIVQSVKRRKAERKRKEIFSPSMKKSSAPQSEMMEVAEEPMRAAMTTAGAEQKESTEKKPSPRDQERISDLLSSAEKQTIQGFQSSSEIVNYARQFNANKALTVLWQGTVNRDNQFAIDVLKNSDQFTSGQKVYLERNYQLLISLLVQEGQDFEAEKYRAKLNALK